MQLFQNAPHNSEESTKEAIKNSVEKCKQKEQRIAELEEELIQAKLEVKTIQEAQLPSLLMELGVSELTLSTGEKIKIKDTITCSISRENKESAFDWLEENGHSGIVDVKVSVDFSLTNSEGIENAKNSLLEAGIDPVVDKKVHSSTMSALAKTLLTSGADFPEKTFGVFVRRKATVK